MTGDAEVIRSRTNPALKRVGAARAGKLPGVLVLEGRRLVEDALRAGCALELVLVAEGADPGPALARAGERRVVAPALLERLSALTRAPGVLALATRPPTPSLEALAAAPDALHLVAAGVADPGNLGALARSAEAAGARTLVLTAGGASPWNEKALRGSMGSLLRVPIAIEPDPARVAACFAEHGARQVVAATRDGADPERFDWSGAVALWVGSETGALPALPCALEPLTIPMAGGVESLNVAVAASLLLFTAARRREERP